MAPLTRSMKKGLRSIKCPAKNPRPTRVSKIPATAKAPKQTARHTRTTPAGASSPQSSPLPPPPPPPRQTFPLFQLPQELADMVYADALRSDTAILRTSHQVHAQAAHLLPQHGTFRIVIEQSWAPYVCYIRPLTSLPPAVGPSGKEFDPQHIEIRIQSTDAPHWPTSRCGYGRSRMVDRARSRGIIACYGYPVGLSRESHPPGNPMLRGLIAPLTSCTATRRVSCRVVLETKLGKVNEEKMKNFLELVASLKAFENVEVVFGRGVEPVPPMKVVERDICPTLGPVDTSMGRRCWRFSPQ